MITVAYTCPKCGHRHHKPGKCDKCQTKLEKVCAHCEHPPAECICN